MFHWESYNDNNEKKNKERINVNRLTQCTSNVWNRINIRYSTVSDSTPNLRDVMDMPDWK